MKSHQSQKHRNHSMVVEYCGMLKLPALRWSYMFVLYMYSYILKKTKKHVKFPFPLVEDIFAVMIQTSDKMAPNGTHK